jgi:8-oxo-dGTP pyrophosphatase MutT (NUDIX family)
MNAKRQPRLIPAAGVLVMRRRPAWEFLLMRHPHRWDIPKGRAERGERTEETALRELAEETGITASAIALDPVFRFETNYPVRYRKDKLSWDDKHLTVFLGWLHDELAADVQIVCTEHPEYAWFPWQPPHAIQAQTIDAVLAAVAEHLLRPPTTV